MKRILLVLAVAVALVVPGAALAASPTCNAYHPTTCTTITTTTSRTLSTSTPTSTSTTLSTATSTPTETEPTTTATTATTEGTLPFTGLDVALLVIGGGTLLGAGLLVRRLSRRPN